MFFSSVRCCASKSGKPRLKTTLNEQHRILAEGGVKPLPYDIEKEKWRIRERFGQFGIASQVDIRKLWPSLEEVAEFKSLKMYRKAKEAIQISDKLQANKEQHYREKLEKVHKKLQELEMTENT